MLTNRLTVMARVVATTTRVAAIRRQAPFRMSLASWSTLSWLRSTTTTLHHQIQVKPPFGASRRWYHTPTAHDIEEFAAILDHEPGSLLQDDDNTTNASSSLAAYNTDWRRQYHGRAAVVLRPKTTQQVSQLLAHCHQRRIAVCPQGGNTGLVGGSVPSNGTNGASEVVLSCERMNQIYDNEQPNDNNNSILYCQAGCVLQDLQAHAAARGWLVPIDLGAKGTCQIGGNLATNAGGQYYYRYGSLAANVVGLQVVLANGDVLNLNYHERDQQGGENGNTTTTVTSNLKDNTGYKLHQLYIGAEGTLGVITAVALQCAPYPRSRQAAFLACHSFDQVTRLITLAKQELGEIVAAVEWMDRACLTSVVQYLAEQQSSSLQLPIAMEQDSNGTTTTTQQKQQPYPHSILLETHGSCPEHDVEKLDRFLTRAMSDDCQDNGMGPMIDNGVLAQDLGQVQDFWAIRELSNPAFTALGYGYKYDLSLPVSQFDSFGARIQRHIMEQEQNNTARNLYYANWGHLLDGNLHLNFTTPGHYELDPHVLGSLEPFVFDEIIRLGGSVSAEHGIGQSKRHLLRRVHDPAVLATMRTLKRALDPHGILNPSKVLPPEE